MSWIPFAIFSAIVLASKRVYEKKLTQKFSNFSMGFIVQAFSLLPTLLLFFFLPIPQDIFALSWRFWWPLLIIWFILYPLQTSFMYRSIREGELSQVTPVMAILPVFSMISSYFIIGELPSAIGVIGVFLIVAGIFILLIKKQTGKGFRFNKAVLYMLLAMVGSGIGTTLDKVAIGASTPVFYSFVNTLGASIVFFILIFVYRKQGEIKEMSKMLPQFGILGIFQALSYTATMFAFSMGPTSYVLSVRSASFLFATIFAYFLYKEKFTGKKAVAFLFFIVGIICIAFG